MSKKKSDSFTDDFNFESFVLEQEQEQREQAFGGQEFEIQDYADLDYEDEFDQRIGPSKTIVALRVIWVIAVVAALVVFGIQLVRSSSAGNNDRDDTPIDINPPSLTQVPIATDDPSGEQTVEPSNTFGPQTSRFPEGGTSKHTPEPSGSPSGNGGGDTRTGRPITTPSARPTSRPTSRPTAKPTNPPIEKPTPTAEPTDDPSAEPSDKPTADPSDEPTTEPSGEPTAEPSDNHTEAPTQEPSDEPTQEPLADPEQLGEPMDGSTAPYYVRSGQNGIPCFVCRFMHSAVYVRN